jgi:hypothetical protein
MLDQTRSVLDLITEEKKTAKDVTRAPPVPQRGFNVGGIIA